MQFLWQLSPRRKWRQGVSGPMCDLYRSLVLQNPSAYTFTNIYTMPEQWTSADRLENRFGHSVATWARRCQWEVWSFLKPCQCTVVRGGHDVVCAYFRIVFSLLFRYLQSHLTFEKKCLKIGNVVVIVMGRKTQQKTSEGLEDGGPSENHPLLSHLLATVPSSTKDMFIPRA